MESGPSNQIRASISSSGPYGMERANQITAYISLAEEILFCCAVSLVKTSIYFTLFGANINRFSWYRFEKEGLNNSASTYGLFRSLVHYMKWLFLSQNLKRQYIMIVPNFRCNGIAICCRVLVKVIKQLISGISVFESGDKIKCIHQIRYQTINIQIIKHYMGHYRK